MNKKEVIKMAEKHSNAAMFQESYMAGFQALATL